MPAVPTARWLSRLCKEALDELLDKLLDGLPMSGRSTFREEWDLAASKYVVGGSLLARR